MRARLVAALAAGALLAAGVVGAGALHGPTAPPPATAAPIALAATPPSVSNGVSTAPALRSPGRSPGTGRRPSSEGGASPPPIPPSDPVLTPPATSSPDHAADAADAADVVPIRPVGAPGDTPPPGDPELVARLQAVLADPLFAGPGSLGVTVVDQDGRAVLDVAGDAPVLPASAQKLVTAAGALAVLGPDFRFTTTVVATTAPDAAGTVAGDLVVVGDGDPTLASPDFAALDDERPETLVGDLAAALAAAGVRRVTGQVVADPGAWVDEPLPVGWIPKYLQELHGVRTQALTIDAGRGLELRDGRLLGVPEEHPEDRLAAHLHAQLAERGVAVEQGWMVQRGARAGTAGPELARLQSPPLGELLRWTVQRSDNQMADQIFRAIGAAAGDPTWNGSAAAIPPALHELGLDWTGSVLADGSGLSREDRLTPRLLAQLDRAMWRSSAATAWVPLLAVAGQTGTLRNRLRETPAAGRLRGKTGTLTDVRSLAGGVEGRTGQSLHFAIVANALDREGRQRVREESDALVEVMAEQLYDCERIPIPQPEPQPAATPLEQVVELRCAA